MVRDSCCNEAMGEERARAVQIVKDAVNNLKKNSSELDKSEFIVLLVCLNSLVKGIEGS